MHPGARFALMIGGLLMLVSGFMPWLGEMRPLRVPIVFLYGAYEQSELVLGAQGVGVPPARSMGVWFFAATALAIIASLYAVRPMAWLGTLAGLAIAVGFGARVLYELGGVPAFGYGLPVALVGATTAVVAGFWSPRRAPGRRGSEAPEYEPEYEMATRPRATPRVRPR
ncbi:MAG TPA: hypothetical protein VI076_02665 [Actinopolymorphaceae bacterium]